jgi:hypothetical protein
MKRISKILLSGIALGASSLIATAQEPGPGQKEDGADRPRRPAPPLVAALDKNHDGVIDADEISNAAAALKTLDKNADGKLTRDEIRPMRRGGGPGEEGARHRKHGKGKEGEQPANP